MLCIGEVEDAKSLDDLITSASVAGRPIPDFENLHFEDCMWTQEDPNTKLQETSYHSRRKGTIGEDITNRQTDCVHDLRLLQNQLRQWSHHGLQRIISSPIVERQRPGLRHEVGRSIVSSHCKIQVEKSEEMEYLLQVYAQETTLDVPDIYDLALRKTQKGSTLWNLGRIAKAQKSMRLLRFRAEAQVWNDCGALPQWRAVSDAHARTRIHAVRHGRNWQNCKWKQELSRG